MGSLRERSPGLWQARIYVGLDPVSGKRQYAARTISAKSSDAAKRELRTFERTVRAGRVQRGTTAISVGSQLEDWYAAKAPRLAPGTRTSYRAAISLCGPLRDIPLVKLASKDLDALYRQLEEEGRSSAYIRKVHQVVSGALDRAVRHELLERNVALTADPPPVRGKATRPPTLDELAKLLDGCDDENFRAFLFTATTTGARRGELVALRWRDIELGSDLMFIRSAIAEGEHGETIFKDTKNHRARTIALDQETVEMLRHHRTRAEHYAEACGDPLTEDRFVFSPRPGSDVPFAPKVLSRRYARLRDRLGISGIRLHDLRHFAGSQLMAAGVDVKTVSGRLGHSRASTTLDIYTHAVHDHDRAAAEVLGTLVTRR